jgi:lambda family phage tail tape measure protein
MAQDLVPSGGGGGTLVITVNASQAISNLNILQARILGVVSNTQQAVTRMGTSFNMMTGWIGKAVTALGGFLVLRQITRIVEGFIGRMIEVNRTFTGFIASMSIIKGSTAAAGDEYKFLIGLSNKIGVSLEHSIVQYHRLAAAMKNVDKTGEITRHIFSGISQAAVVLQASGRDVTLIFEAVQQMASKGRLSLEELQRQLGNTLPGAIGIAARAMMSSSSFMDKGIKTVGAAEQELREQIRTGTINVYEFLARFSDTLKKEYGAGVAVVATSFQANFARMQNSIFEFYRAVGSSKAMEGLTKIVQEVAALFNDASADAAAGLGQSIGSAFENIANWISKLDSADIMQFFSTLQVGFTATGVIVDVFLSSFAGFGDAKMKTPLLDFAEFCAKTLGILVDAFKFAVETIEFALRGMLGLFQAAREGVGKVADFTVGVAETVHKYTGLGDVSKVDEYRRMRAEQSAAFEANANRLSDLTTSLSSAVTEEWGGADSASSQISKAFADIRKSLGDFKPGVKAGSTADETSKYFNPLGDFELQQLIEQILASTDAPGGKGKKGPVNPSTSAYMRETTRLVKELATAQNELDNITSNRNKTEGKAEAQMRALLSTDERYLKMTKDQKDALLATAIALDNKNKQIEQAIKVQDSYNDTLQNSFDVQQRLKEIGATGFESQYRNESDTARSFMTGGANEQASQETQRKLTADAIKRDMDQRNLDMAKYIQSIKLSNDEMIFQSSLYGKSQLEVQKMTEYRRIDLEIQKMMVGASEELQASYIQLGITLKESVGKALDEIAAKQADAFGGMKAGLTEYMDSIRDVSGQMKDVTMSAFSGMEDALVNFAETGKLSFKDLANSIVKDLLRIIIRMMIMAFLQNILGMGQTSAPTGNFGIPMPGSGGGNFFLGGSSKGNIIPHAKGGVYNQTSMFATGGMVGTAFEKNSEAIMPLARDRSGMLGVKVANPEANGGGETSMNLKIEVYQGEGTGVKTEKTSDGQGDVLKLFIGEVSADIKRGGPVAQAMTQVYGIKRSPKVYG